MGFKYHNLDASDAPLYQDKPQLMISNQTVPERNNKSQKNWACSSSEVMRTDSELRLQPLWSPQGQTQICQHPSLMQLSIDSKRDRILLPKYPSTYTLLKPAPPLHPQPTQTMPGPMDHLLLAGIALSQDTDLGLARTTSQVSGRMRVFVTADSKQELHSQRQLGGLET